MPDATPIAAPPKRRWYQYSLRTLFVFVTLLAIPCGYVGSQYRIVAHRKAAREMYKGKAIFLSASWASDSAPPPTIPWVRRLLGDEAVMVLFRKAVLTSSDEQELRETFPEAFSPQK